MTPTCVSGYSRLEPEMYKTAVELGIEEWERDGLLALVDPLDRGEIKMNVRLVTAGIEAALFDITGRCRRDLMEYVNSYSYDRGRHKTLRRLYYPGSEIDDQKDYVSTLSSGYDATPAQAAAAIRNFLATGDPMWGLVMLADRDE